MTDEIFNRGLTAFLDDQSAEAVQKALPRMSEAVQHKALLEYREIFSAACRRVRNDLEDHKTEIETRNAVGEIDPRVSAENATTLFAIARTSAWRDGFN